MLALATRAGVVVTGSTLGNGTAVVEAVGTEEVDTEGAGCGEAAGLRTLTCGPTVPVAAEQAASAPSRTDTRTAPGRRAYPSWLR